MSEILINHGKTAQHNNIDILIEDGEIKEISDTGEINVSAEVEFDADGALVTHTFSEPHVHLDQALSAGTPSWNDEGTLMNGISLLNARQENPDKSDIKTRAKQAIRWYVANGVNRLRSHVNVSDPNLTFAEAMLEVKNDLEHVVDIELVGLPRGILTDPTHIDRMKEAMQMGLDYVGGVPGSEYTYEEGVESVKICMDIAEKNDAGVDIHADETDDPNSRFTEVIASETIKRDFPGQVTASHCTAMHSYPNQYANKLINRLAEAGVNVITNPPDNMVLQAAYDDYPKRRGHTRVDELHDGGVTVGLGHDSVMDPIYEYGKADPLDAAYLLAHFAHMHKHEDVETLWRMLIDSNAQFFSKMPKETKIAEGNEASLIVHAASTPFEVLRTRANRRLVISKGNIVARTEPKETTVNLNNEKSVNFIRHSG